MTFTKLRLGTRPSILALTQTELVAEALRQAMPGLRTETVKIRTKGDKNQETKRSGVGDKKDWIFELEKAILTREVDLAVHSGKDVPSEIEDGTALVSVLKRANPRDAFVCQPLYGSFADLSSGATIGTSSLRRRAQLLRLRPDLSIVEHRGNVPTRIRKLREGDGIEGIVLACAGLERLGMSEHITEEFSPRDMMPAINQGTLVVQYRKDDAELTALLSSVSHRDTGLAWLAERGCVGVLGADCNSAVSIYGEVIGDEVSLSCRILSYDGARSVEETMKASTAEAEQIGVLVGKRVLEDGGRELLEECRIQLGKNR